ncbi:MAG: hypothetical protein JXR77_15180, partial [Lentisphaeria bacterium]|nr:hypothetical protein [Lentisphaeria bacterium]
MEVRPSDSRSAVWARCLRGRLLLGILWLCSCRHVFAAPAGGPEKAAGTVTYELKSGLARNWVFDNPAEEWRLQYHGYWRDFNSNGLPDYLVVQSNSTTDEMRIFCIDTANADAPKTYPADRVAWREIPAVEGTFVPNSAHFVKPAAEERIPDIVVEGSDSAGAAYSKLVFQRLDETSATFAQEASWSIPVDPALEPQSRWTADTTGDGYPDLLVYHRRMDGAGSFRVACHSGLTGVEAWSKALPRHADDADFGTGSRIIAFDLGAGDIVGSGDLDDDGFPDLLLTYGFSYFDMGLAQTGVRGFVKVLSGATGDPLTGYAAWWELYNATGAYLAPTLAPAFDFDGDGYQDMVLMETMGLVASLPPYRALSLRTRTVLFETPSSDFGPTVADHAYYSAQPALGLAPAGPRDVTGDGGWDLLFARYMAVGPAQPLRYGLFHAYANGTGDKGRKVWLADVPAPYDSISPNANDWNGDGILDLAFVDTPETPTTTKGCAAEWTFALQTVGGTTPGSLQQTSAYDIPHTGTWEPADDAFSAVFTMMALMGDIDQDTQQDTLAAIGCSFDYGDDGNADRTYRNYLFFDTTPGSAPPDTTAELAVTMDGGRPSDLMGFVTMAALAWTDAWVDQNGDGAINDIVVAADRMVFALSFTAGGGPVGHSVSGSLSYAGALAGPLVVEAYADAGM